MTSRVQTLLFLVYSCQSYLPDVLLINNMEMYVCACVFSFEICERFG